jgi:hypothetical protein
VNQLVPDLRKLQEDFLAYLIGNGSAIMDNVVEQGDIDRKTRLDIYQNAYNVRLKNCVETDHPMLGLYLGDNLFDQMVKGYIQQHPSCYRSLRQFCNHLPDYLSRTEPFKSHPIIAEIAQFERRLLDAFDAADSNSATETELQRLPTEQWPEMKLTFHPSVYVFEAQWNSVECWQALKNEMIPPEARREESWWIIWRNSERLTQYCSLSVDGFVIYQCFKDHYTFADACELLTEHLPENQIALASVKHLESWFSLGIIESIQ